MSFSFERCLFMNTSVTQFLNKLLVISVRLYLFHRADNKPVEIVIAMYVSGIVKNACCPIIATADKLSTS